MNQSGMTLLELLVVLAVSASLLTIGIPSFASLIHSSHVTSATNELVGSLHLARAEAIKRGGRIVICPSATGVACSGADWHQGWVMFHDQDNDAALDAYETVVLRRRAMPAGYRLTGNLPVSRYVSYTPTGSAKSTSGAWQFGTLTVCRESRDRVEARQVVIASTGRPRTVKVMLDACL
jgi:type IV fimbrial biogenesis protein FimT